MKKLIKVGLLLSSLTIISLSFAQGNGSSNGNSSNVVSPNCRPTTIVGENNPDPGQVYTYSHDYDVTTGEQFVWEVEGALELDGQATDANNEGMITKQGQSIDIIWDGDSPTGKLKVTPASTCAGLAQSNGGLGGVIVLQMAGWCTPEMWVDFDCDGNTSLGETSKKIIPGTEYTFEYAKPDCNNDVYHWTFKNALTVNGDPVGAGWQSTTIYLSRTISVSFRNTSDIHISCIPDDQNTCGWAGVCGIKPANLTPSIRTGYPGFNYVISHPHPTFVNNFLRIENVACSHHPLMPNELIVSLPNDPDVKSYHWSQSSNSGYGVLTHNNTRTCTLDIIHTGYIMCEVEYNGSSCTETYIWNLVDNNQPTIAAPIPILQQPCPGDNIIILDQGDLNHVYYSAVEVTSGTATVIGTYTDPVTGVHGIGININGNTQIPIRTKQKLGTNCGETGWNYETITVTPNAAAPDPITDITSNFLCQNENYHFEAIQINSSSATYDWKISYDGVQEPVISTQTNHINGIMSGANIVMVEVTAYNSCGSTTYSKSFNANSATPLYTPSIIPPTSYCANTANTFSVNPPPSSVSGLEYTWTIFGYKGGAFFTEQEVGIDQTSFTPDFGLANGHVRVCNDGTEINGAITNFTVALVIRNCDAASSAVFYSENNVNYNTCCGSSGGGGFSIELLPNPAQNHVNVKFPTGGGNKNIKIIDAYGTEKKNVNTTSASQIIDVTDLQFGIYSVIATDGNNFDAKQLQITP